MTAPGHLTRVFILERCRLFSQSVAALLQTQERIRFVGSSTDPDEAAALARAHSADVLLLDSAAGHADTVRLTRDLSAELARVAVVVAAVEDRDEAVLELLEAGASGYVLASASFADLVHTLERVSQGEAVCPPRIAAAVCQRIRTLGQARTLEPACPLTPLSPRETEILRFVARGRLNKEIAVELGISLCTVKNHVHNILRKLNVSHRRATGRLNAVEHLLA